jgi:hypothetical protein
MDHDFLVKAPHEDTGLGAQFGGNYFITPQISSSMKIFP